LYTRRNVWFIDEECSYTVSNLSSSSSSSIHSLLINTTQTFSQISNVNVQLGRLRDKAARFHELLRTTDTANNPEFNVLRKALGKDIRIAEKDINGLRQAIDVVSGSRHKFPLITDVELQQRRDFVTSSAANINEVRSKMESESARDKMAQDEQRAKARDASNPALGSPLQNENSRFINNQVAEQKYMIGEQDLALDGLSSAVDRLGVMSKEVNIELKEQNRMLDELEGDLDEAGNKMNVVTAKLAKLLKTKDGCTIWTVVILTLIFAILLGLVIYT